ncbi:PREDICTED: RNA-binding protein MEX3B, partial [Condylura cristata]|uniref:RNA-binding protein MEX3B n=1 Tax=Condylura cristata TaxID=143302 RepID=UPI0003347FE4
VAAPARDNGRVSLSPTPCPAPRLPGCKIKALRAKTNTYIKTPVRGEEPVFVVTGRKEDVAMARREIISAAEHFSLIRASRNKNAALNGAAPGPPHLPGQTTIQVRVPYRVVGLVVGPKGATIKRIQQQTHTYIVTPSRDKEPVFEVTGMPENVDRAREEIEAHIALRTGGLVELTDDNDFHANGTDVGFDLHHGAGGAGPGSLWSKPTPSIAPTPGRRPLSSYRDDSSSSLGSACTDSHFGGSAAATPRLGNLAPPVGFQCCHVKHVGERGAPGGGPAPPAPGAVGRLLAAGRVRKPLSSQQPSGCPSPTVGYPGLQCCGRLGAEPGAGRG